MENNASKKIKQYIPPLSCAAIQWAVWQLAGIGKGFLDYDISRPYVWVQKALFLCLLISLWCFGFYIARQAGEGNIRVKRGLSIFAVYFSILMLFLILLWPGTWYWDDIGVLASARYYDVLPWQHFLSSFFQNIFLQLVPTPGGVILVQLLIAGVIVAYVLTDLEETFCNGQAFLKHPVPGILIRLIPFLLPPVILYQYSGFRMGMYIFYEVFVLGFILCISYRKRRIGWTVLLFAGLATAVLSMWRTEGFLYAPVVILLLCLQDKDMLPLKKKLFTIGVIFMGILAISSYQKAKSGNSDYSVVAILRPLSEVVRAADPVEDKELLEAIDRVVGTEVILDNPGENGEDLLWKFDLPIYEYTGEEYSDFMKAFVGLCIRHPKAVAKERIKVFLDTSAIRGRTNPTNVTGAYYLYDPVEQNDNQREFVSWDAAFNRPVSAGLRQRFILLLGALRSDFSEMITYRLVWDTIIPIAVIILLWVYLLIKKEWKAFTAISAVALRLPILFLTAPATWTMYYLSFYLTGYIALVWIVIIVLWRKRTRAAGFERETDI
ncbi:MAG: hypothetical protein J5966_01210 [Lachnospiraceae bacterium]|nr:hypothetical protein [Lachnospiraceae bacterium]